MGSSEEALKDCLRLHASLFFGIQHRKNKQIGAQPIFEGERRLEAELHSLV